jgi:hypothetical protein
MASHTELEMRWIAAWNDLYDIVGQRTDIGCVLPDGQIVDVEACKGWLQESAYEGWHIAIERGTAAGRRVVLARRWRA